MEFSLERTMEVLSRTPAVLRAMLAGVGEEWNHGRYGPKTFSPFDVLGHLIHGEKTDWVPRARMILQYGESRVFEPFDRYAMYEDSKGKTAGQLLDEFERLRSETIGELRTMKLSDEKLNLRGTHPELGPVTLRQLLATWTVHDLNHIHQIAKAMAFQYRTHLGPWLEYVGVLKS